jgi:Essential protein Yae1, N terminal
MCSIEGDTMSDDLLDSVLDLEEDSYQAGFDEGKADGAEAGYAEGLTFGIEKGYQKALEIGKLHGRALMLNACLFDPISTSDNTTISSESNMDDDANISKFPGLPTLPDNPRLKKHVETLLKLTDPDTLSADNSDEAVDDFDERMKKAIAKAKVIDKLIAEPCGLKVSGEATKEKSQPAAGSGNIEELNNLAVRR